MVLLNFNTDIHSGSYEIFVPYKHTMARVVINPIRPIIFDAHKRLFLDKRGEAAAPIEGKVGLNRRFVRQFTALWAIMVAQSSSYVDLGASVKLQGSRVTACTFRLFTRTDVVEFSRRKIRRCYRTRSRRRKREGLRQRIDILVPHCDTRKLQ
jgi:hypothetical protein